MENEQFYLDKFKTEADYILFDVPRKCRTSAICLAAVKRDWQNLSLVPYDLRTAEICVEALKHEGEKHEMLPYIPKTIQDPQVWLLAVKNGFDIRRVPPELLSEEMCISTVAYKWKDWFDEWRCEGQWLDHDWFDDEWDPHSLPQGLCDDVPEQFRTRAFWLATIRANAIFIRYTPEHFKTDDFYWDAARSNGAILEYVPEEFETPEFFLEAIKSSNKALSWVPKKYRTKALYGMAVKCNGTALEYVPEKLKTAELCMAAFNQVAGALMFFPAKMKTYDLCLKAAAFNKRFYMLRYPTKRFFYEVLDHGFLLQIFPKKYLTYECGS